jgi:hypothetical protein
LQIDAGVVGWLENLFVPGATWSGTVVYTPSGHTVEITSPCASFHNLSLPSLCCAQSMLRSKKWSWLKAWAMQIARRRGMKKAIVALARRLAVIMHRIWVDGTEFRWTRETVAA